MGVFAGFIVALITGDILFATIIATLLTGDLAGSFIGALIMSFLAGEDTEKEPEGGRNYEQDM